MVARFPFLSYGPALRRTLGLILATGPAWGLFGSAYLAAQTLTLTEAQLRPFTYRSIGPTRQGGRFVDFAVPLQQPGTFYAATASGHLWKTTNHGNTFEPLFENEAVFSIGDIAVAPSDPNILYVGTGEANNSRSSYWGNGVYRSDDGGRRWTHLGLEESHHIGRVVVHPRNPNIVYVAALGHLYSENPERGLYKTTDGGKNWKQVLAPVVGGKTIGVVDVAMDPSNPDVLYAATYDKVRLPFTFDLGGPGSRVYKTTDGGETWQMLTNGLPQGMLGRIGIDIYLRDPRIVYLSIENANKPGMSDEERLRELREHKSSQGMIDGEVYRSDDAGATWRKVSPDGQSIGGNPGYYYGQIRVDPNNPDVVYVLSVATMKSTDGGRTWNRNAFGYGGDDHALWIDPDNSNHILLGHDHGMGISWDGGRTWYNVDNLPLAQFYAVGFDMSWPYRVAGGTQDNGSHLGPSTNPAGGPIRLEHWFRVGGGDGMYNEFETCTNRYLYNESQFGPISRLDLWTGERKNIRYPDPELRWNWNAPILVSPHDCNVIYHAANKLLRSPNMGESWEVISPDLTKADPRTLTTGKGGDGNIQYATITTISESPIQAGLLWVGTDDGNVQVTRDGGRTWTAVHGNIFGHPGYWVSRVEASFHQAGTAYVSVTGYRNDDFRPFLYKTTDFGASFVNIAANLPNEPINVIREHPSNPNLLFVGTEFAVYVSVDGGKSWSRMKNNMPTQPVHDLKIHPRENDIIVATHGRGIYIADISALVEVTPEVMAREAYFFQPESKVRWVGADLRHSSSKNYAGESEPSAVVFYYHLKNAAPGPVTFTVYQGQTPIATVQGPAEVGMHKVHWAMDRRLEGAQVPAAGPPGGGQAGRGGGQARGQPAAPGEYRVVMTVGNRMLQERRVSILKDEWWMMRQR